MKESVVMPAEWELDCAVLLSWPHSGSDWNYMLPQITGTYVELAKAIMSKGIPLIIVAPNTSDARKSLSATKGTVLYFDVQTNDTWTRDFGPITILKGDEPAVVDFKFNGWGLKFSSDRDNLVTLKMCECGLITAERINRLGFVLEGGSIESDGKGTILTTARCLESPNRNGELSRAGIESRLKEWLGADRILWLEHGALEGDDTDSHIDTLARLAPNDTIIYTGCQDTSDSHYEELSKMKHEIVNLRTAEGKSYNLVELPLPSPIYDEDGNRLPATYSNYLVTPRAVFMPTYNQPLNDMTAAGMVGAVFEREVVSVDCLSLIQQHGSLHCATMQIPLKALCL
ncbi:MAG: agmatine deiminase family protein [Paramuribaculum sp.]|nr:agmatine deiminase family protein [Paramuribaculum sp.]